jgi:hypothetical protein
MNLTSLMGLSRVRNKLKATRRPCRPRMEGLERRDVPATFTVANLADSGVGSLRGAVQVANLVPGADTINFAPGLTGQISLTSGQIDISSSLTINGTPGSPIVLSGLDQSRIFNVHGNNTVTLANLNFVHGSATDGGAIQDVNATLNLINDQFFSNAAKNDGGAVLVGPSAHLNMANDRFVNNTAGNDGGAVANHGIMTDTASTYIHNQAEGDGGAVFNDGLAASLTGDTFTGNSAGAEGGYGGAFASSGEDATISLLGDTFLGNAAANGGAYSQLGGQATLTGLTMLGNNATDGGGIYVRNDTPGTQLGMLNSTIEFNTATDTGGGVLASLGVFTDLGGNTIKFNTPNDVVQLAVLPVAEPAPVAPVAPVTPTAPETPTTPTTPETPTTPTTPETPASPAAPIQVASAGNPSPVALANRNGHA